MNVKKLVCSIISLSLLVNSGIAALPVSASAVDTDTEIYVSPDGNDSNSGSSESPFKTLERAKAEVRVHNSNMSGNIIVNIASGVYYMDNTLEFTQADSGTNGFSVIYRGITDENRESNSQRRVLIFPTIGNSMMNRLIFISMKILIGLSDNCILTMTAPYAQGSPNLEAKVGGPFQMLQEVAHIRCL